MTYAAHVAKSRTFHCATFSQYVTAHLFFSQYFYTTDKLALNTLVLRAIIVCITSTNYKNYCA